MEKLFLFLLFINLNNLSNQKEEIKKNKRLTYTNEDDFDINCTNEKCNLENAQCKKNVDGNLICNCYKCYTYNRKEKLYCGYAQKRQSTAFLLEIIPGFGAGYYYIGRKTYAIIKCVFFIIAMFSICLFPIIAKFILDKYDSDSMAICFSMLFYTFVYTITLWYLGDLSSFSLNLIKDSEEYPLCRWGGSI